MTKTKTILAIAMASGLLAACQTQQVGFGGMRGPAVPEASPVDGQWRSGDGIFIANFQGGNFTSVDAQTQSVLARGNYVVQRDGANLQWTSALNNQQRSATCTFAGPNMMNCVQGNGSSFVLQRA